MNRSPLRQEHLQQEEFFLLVFPPAGIPAALPPHLSSCPACTGLLQEWRAAAEGLARPAAGAVPEFEESVMARIRAAGPPRRQRVRPRVVAALLAAAAALAVAFWLGREAASAPELENVRSSVASMSPSDSADDKLLRDVSRLVSAEESDPWSALAPLPEVSKGNS